MSVRAIRGATQVESNTASAITSATQELILEILKANSLTPDQVISVLFTSSPDLDATFPAAAARSVGFEDTPLICAVEIDVAGALPRTVRVMAHVESELPKKEISHIYLHGAKALRRDISQ
jgi:chorismate mutase